MNRQIKILSTSILIGIFIFLYLLVNETSNFQFSKKVFEYFSFFLIPVILIAYSLSFTNLKVEQNTKLKNNFALWFLLIFPLDLLITILILYLGAIVFNNLFFDKINFETFLIRNYDLSLKIIFLSVLSILIYIISDYFLSAYFNYMEIKLKGEKIAADNLRLNFEALENQLKPHYLFNNLNTISALIYIDKQKAENYIRQLAHTYRYVLDCSHQKLVTVEKELNFINAYIYLVRIRYENALIFKISINEPAKNAYIVPLSLQILIENALKHNVITEKKPMKINIFNQDDYLIVENSIQPLEIQDTTLSRLKKIKSNKIGLKNIEERYKLICNKEVLIKKNNKFRVEIPILPSNE